MCSQGILHSRRIFTTTANTKKEEPLYQMSYAKVLARVGSRGGFHEERLGTVPYPTWIVPASAKMAPLLARGKQSISPAGSASGKIYVRKGKKQLIPVLREASEKYVTATAL